MISVDSARALELDSFLELVAALARTDLGHRKVRLLASLADPDRLETLRAATAECQQLYTEGPLVPASDHEFIPLLATLDDPLGEVDGPMLRRLASLLAIGLEGASRITDAKSEGLGLEQLAKLCPALAAGEELLEHLRRVLDRRGQVRDRATPRLARLRREVRRTRDHTLQALESVVEHHRDQLSDETIPQRHGRFVVKLKSGSKGRIEGLVHDRSGTGKSLYLEPLEAIEGNNELRRLSSDAEAEERRILAELVAAFRGERELLAELGAAVAKLDRLQAGVRFARLCNGSLAASSTDGHLRLVAARHPLLDPSLANLREEVFGQAGHRGPIVPLDLDLGGDHRALVVSGPNAGGKTVAMKTVGLLAAAHHCGLPLPAGEGTEIPDLSGIVAAIGDQQDMLAEKSTFSGKLLRLAEAWERRGPKVLVLLDELGDGTGPEEGAALGISLLEALVEKGSMVVITTHLVQLAAATESLAGASSAAMEFDGGPTFRLVAGAPGGSEAIALGRRLGLPDAWLGRAEELLGSEYRSLRQLMATLDETRRFLEEERAELSGELNDAESLRRRAAAELERASEDRKTIRARLAREWSELRSEVRGRLRDELAELREMGNQGRHAAKRVAPPSLAAITEKTLGPLPEELKSTSSDSDGRLEKGAEVEHRLYRWRGELVEIKGQRAEVRVGGKLVRCGLGELERRSPNTEKTGLTGSSSVSGLYSEASAEIDAELNLVGERVEPALERLRRYLDQAVLSSHSSLRIVHGFGSGRLRRAVREHLRSHPGVVASRPAHPSRGGDGATEVELDEKDNKGISPHDSR